MDKILADGLEQNRLRGMIATGGFWGCARCKTKGTTLKKGTVYYPMSEICPHKKTHEMWVAMFRDHGEWFPGGEVHPKYKGITKDVRCGIDRRSPLLDLPGFDIVEGVRMDALHLFHIGITKKLWERIEGGDEDLSREVAQGALVSNISIVVDVLDFLEIPHDGNGFFDKDASADERLQDGWQGKVMAEFSGKHPEDLLLLYVNHLDFELGEPQEVFLG